MDLRALQQALDLAIASNNPEPFTQALRAAGWRLAPRAQRATEAEILARIKVDPETGCWNWTKKLDNGYGGFKGTGAHRASWEAFNGPIPEGLDLDHVCRNRACVNPTTVPPLHLEPVTKAANDRRARAYVQQHPEEQVHNKAKRWCKHGHEYTPENTGMDKLGKRFCLACRRDHLHRWKQRLRETQPAHGGRWHVDAEAWLAARDTLVPTLDGPTMKSIEVAALWGITHQALSRWRSRNPNLLRPVSGGGRGTMLRWSAAEATAIMAFRTSKEHETPASR